MRAIALALPALLLAGCGHKSATTANTTATANDQTAVAGGGSAFDGSFRASYRAKFIQSCATGAKTAAAGNAKLANADFTPLCGCAADKLLASKQVSELMRGVSPADQAAVTQQCLKEHPIS